MVPNVKNNNLKEIKMTELVQLVPNNSLLTKTPEEGRQLAVKIARLIIKVTQPDAALREKMRPTYA